MPIGPMIWSEFALDSPMEEAGFEPSVPLVKEPMFSGREHLKDQPSPSTRSQF
jgi:hypothetical protein